MFVTGKVDEPNYSLDHGLNFILMEVIKELQAVNYI